MNEAPYGLTLKEEPAENEKDTKTDPIGLLSHRG